jgi:plastocyanin
MRRLIAVAMAVGIVSLAVLSLSGRGPDPVAATHGVFNKHVHDDYFHPTGSFVPGPGHAQAKALCEGATFNNACIATIHEGDAISWVAPAPLAVNPHSVTECTDNTFTVCGAGTSSPNPIEDSGVRFQPGWPYNVTFNDAGTFYYRCEVHPTIMRGQVTVLGDVGGTVELPGNGGAGAPAAAAGDDSSSTPYLLVAGLVALVAAAGVGMFARKRFAREEITTE